MLFDREYECEVRRRLHLSFNEREPAVGEITVHRSDSNEVMLVAWEPGDMTRYEAYVVMLPIHPHVLVCGLDGTHGAWALVRPLGDHLHTNYFREKNPTFLPGQYTFRKTVQLAAAMLHMQTNANEPPNYEEDDA